MINSDLSQSLIKISVDNSYKQIQQYVKLITLNEIKCSSHFYDFGIVSISSEEIISYCLGSEDKEDYIFIQRFDNSINRKIGNTLMIYSAGQKRMATIIVVSINEYFIIWESIDNRIIMINAFNERSCPKSADNTISIELYSKINFDDYLFDDDETISITLLLLLSQHLMKTNLRKKQKK